MEQRYEKLRFQSKDGVRFCVLWDWVFVCVLVLFVWFGLVWLGLGFFFGGRGLFICLFFNESE